MIIGTNPHRRFAESVIKALKGQTGIVESTFVYLPGVAGGDEIAKATGVDFFSTLITLGVSNGISISYKKRANSIYRPMAPRRLPTCSRVSPIRRRSSLKLALVASRAILRRASTSSRTPHQSKCSSLPTPDLQSVIQFNAAPDHVSRCSRYFSLRTWKEPH